MNCPFHHGFTAHPITGDGKKEILFVA